MLCAPFYRGNTAPPFDQSAIGSEEMDNSAASTSAWTDNISNTRAVFSTTATR